MTRTEFRSDGGAIAFGENLLFLLDEGAYTATYKYAVLLGLLELCREYAGSHGEPPSIVTTRQLAEKVVEIYWPQAIPFPGRSKPRVLQQNSGDQAEILTAIQRFRERYVPDPSAPLSWARRKARSRFEQLVRRVEWKLVQMPLPRLQRMGDSEHRFIYEYSWEGEVLKRDLEGPNFDNRIHLVGNSGRYLLQLEGLLQPLIRRQWSRMVARYNRDVLEQANLEDFLFGSERIDLTPIRAPLRELQENRCFYCNTRLAGPVTVDHFIPWARHPDNGIENLVVADERCNGSKRDFLASTDHVAQWKDRFDSSSRIARELVHRV